MASLFTPHAITMVVLASVDAIGQLRIHDGAHHLRLPRTGEMVGTGINVHGNFVHWLRHAYKRHVFKRLAENAST